jgi:hypothetical protein
MLKCDLCSKKFRRPAGLGSHKRRVHGIRGKSALHLPKVSRRPRDNGHIPPEVVDETVLIAGILKTVNSLTAHGVAYLRARLAQ